MKLEEPRNRKSLRCFIPDYRESACGQLCVSPAIAQRQLATVVSHSNESISDIIGHRTNQLLVIQNTNTHKIITLYV